MLRRGSPSRSVMFSIKFYVFVNTFFTQQNISSSYFYVTHHYMSQVCLPIFTCSLFISRTVTLLDMVGSGFLELGSKMRCLFFFLSGK